jgi:hypothetical protein
MEILQGHYGTLQFLLRHFHLTRLSLSLDRSIDREVILGNWRRGNPQGTKEEKNKQKTQEGGEHTLTNKGSSRHCNCRLLFKEKKTPENFSA